MGFWHCILWLAGTGIAAFVLGRILPKRWFRGDRFPFRSFSFERDGKIYDRIRIKTWQNKVPDMSRILPKVMPAKRLAGNGKEGLPRMVQETCVAEFIHALLSVLSLFCLYLWPGVGGAVIVVLYVLGNLPYILIQRYNRPRLMKLLARYAKRAQNGQRAEVRREYESTDSEL